MSIVSEVARRLGVKPEVLEKNAVKLWLQRRLRLIEAEMISILRRYNVATLEELEAKMEKGELPEHPTWEDLIVLENLEEERRRITEVLEEIERYPS